MPALQPIITALPTIAVAAVYCVWSLAEALRKKKERRLRDRVTWMLWVMANEMA